MGPTVFLFSQNNENGETKGKLNEYDRSSIATMMVYHSEDTFRNDIKTAFYEVPTPDKYNDHNFTENRAINNDSIRTIPKRMGLIKAGLGKRLNSKEILVNGVAIEKMLNKENYGREMVSKWFNFHTDSLTKKQCFDIRLIQERGQYNATEMDVAIAEHSARGMALLSDAGEDLIKNTFILVNDMTYVTVEEQVQIAQAAISLIGGISDIMLGQNSTAGREMSNTFKELTDDFTGFKVKTNSYLYQLQWNDSVAAVFYKNYYTAGATPDEGKVKHYLSDDSTFTVRFVAQEYEYDKQATLKGTYDRGEFIKAICARSIDKNIAALQLSYEDFKVKTPVYDVIGEGKSTRYAAKIGMKEGINEKSKFQVVQRIFDPETNRTKYKYVATVKPEKDKIWDNRYAAATEKSRGAELKYTTFLKVSGGEILPGMLMIEGKYRKVKE